MKSRFKEVFIAADNLDIDLDAILKSTVSEIKIAFILHDKNDCRPHYHIFLDYGEKRVDDIDVMKLLNVCKHYVVTARGRTWADIKRYLTHTNTNDYSESDIKANFDLSIY